MNKILIVGGMGVVGRAALRHFETLEGWEIVGLSRRKPNFPTTAEWINVDLRDRDACEAQSHMLRGVTHICYAAVWEKPDLTKGWGELDHSEANVLMLRNIVQVVEKSSPDLRHVTIVHGTKAYGAHLGPFKMPGREDDDRYMGPSFYYGQEDWLASRRGDSRWSWTILRPRFICGTAIGSPLNIIPAIGAFSAISREYGIPLRFPGGPGYYMEATDARLLAKAIAWAGQEPACANQIFNIHNGDIFVWENIWLRFADLFGMRLGPPHRYSLEKAMPQNAPVWDRIVLKYDLQKFTFDEIVPSWQFADYVFGYGQQTPDPRHLSTIKIRKFGFHDCIDSEDMFVELIAELQDLRVLPPRESR